jgi:hypothetical protein
MEAENDRGCILAFARAMEHSDLLLVEILNRIEGKLPTHFPDGNLPERFLSKPTAAPPPGAPA